MGVPRARELRMRVERQRRHAHTAASTVQGHGIRRQSRSVRPINDCALPLSTYHDRWKYGLHLHNNGERNQDLDFNRGSWM